MKRIARLTAVFLLTVPFGVLFWLISRRAFREGHLTIGGD